MRIIFPGFPLVEARDRLPFFFKDKKYSIVCVYCMLFICYQPVDTGHFHLLAVMNSTAMTPGVLGYILNSQSTTIS
jgi:hypothetical protein